MFFWEQQCQWIFHVLTHNVTYVHKSNAYEGRKQNSTPLMSINLMLMKEENKIALLFENMIKPESIFLG